MKMLFSSALSHQVGLAKLASLAVVMMLHMDLVHAPLQCLSMDFKLISGC